MMSVGIFWSKDFVYFLFTFVFAVSTTLVSVIYTKQPIFINQKKTIPITYKMTQKFKINELIYMLFCKQTSISLFTIDMTNSCEYYLIVPIPNNCYFVQVIYDLYHENANTSDCDKNVGIVQIDHCCHVL